MDTTRALVVEFGTLDRWQQMLVDLHRLRALGVSELPRAESGRMFAAFWLEQDVTSDDVYAEITRWASGHGLPLVGLVDRQF